MGNCLVTKLKGVVDNNNLEWFNCFKLKSLPGNINVFANVWESAKIIGNGHFCSDNTFSDNIGKELIRTTSPQIYAVVEDSDAILLVKDNYAATRISCAYDCVLHDTDMSFFNSRGISQFDFPIDETVFGEIKDASNINEKLNLRIDALKTSKVKLNFNTCPIGSDITELVLDNLDITGDVSHLGTLNNLTTLKLSNTHITGDIGNLNLPACTLCFLFNTNLYGNIAGITLSNSATRLLLGRTDVTGTIEALAESILSNGRTSGELQVTSSKYTTFNNVVANDLRYSLIFGTNSVVVKNTLTDVTLGSYNGSTWTYA